MGPARASAPLAAGSAPRGPRVGRAWAAGGPRVGRAWAARNACRAGVARLLLESSDPLLKHPDALRVARRVGPLGKERPVTNSAPTFSARRQEDNWSEHCAPGVLPNLELRRCEKMRAQRSHGRSVRRRLGRRLEVRLGAPQRDRLGTVGGAAAEQEQRALEAGHATVEAADFARVVGDQRFDAVRTHHGSGAPCQRPSDVSLGGVTLGLLQPLQVGSEGRPAQTWDLVSAPATLHSWQMRLPCSRKAEEKPWLAGAQHGRRIQVVVPGRLYTALT